MLQVCHQVSHAYRERCHASRLLQVGLHAAPRVLRSCGRALRGARARRLGRLALLGRRQLGRQVAQRGRVALRLLRVGGLCGAAPQARMPTPPPLGPCWTRAAAPDAACGRCFRSLVCAAQAPAADVHLCALLAQATAWQPSAALAAPARVAPEHEQQGSQAGRWGSAGQSARGARRACMSSWRSSSSVWRRSAASAARASASVASRARSSAASRSSSCARLRHHISFP